MTRRDPQRIIVTGSEGAFGQAICERLEARGDHVRGIDLAAMNERTSACDITDVDAVAHVVAELAIELGGIDVLLNVAGIGSAWPLSEPPSEYELRTLDVNVVGTWNVTAAAMPWLLDARGHVVNVASLLAVVTLPWTGAYTASKRAVCAMSDVLRAEHRADGLTVTTVYPGYVATPIHDHAEARSGSSLKGLVPEERVEQVVRALEKAVDRRPRECATSLGGAFALRIARHFPGLLDRAIVRRAKRKGVVRPDAFPSPHERRVEA